VLGGVPVLNFVDPVDGLHTGAFLTKSAPNGRIFFQPSSFNHLLSVI